MYTHFQNMDIYLNRRYWMLSFFCQILWHTTEVGCYTGTALSAVLAWRLFRHIWKRWLMIIGQEEAFFDFSFSIVKHQQTSIACSSGWKPWPGSTKCSSSTSAWTLCLAPSTLTSSSSCSGKGDLLILDMCHHHQTSHLVPWRTPIPLLSLSTASILSALSTFGLSTVISSSLWWYLAGLAFQFHWCTTY